MLDPGGYTKSSNGLRKGGLWFDIVLGCKHIHLWKALSECPVDYGTAFRLHCIIGFPRSAQFDIKAYVPKLS